MARSASPKRSSGKKKPAKSKIKKTTGTSRNVGNRKGPAKVVKAPRAKGKPRNASTPSAKRASTASPGETRVEVRNVNVPGYRNTVDASKYGSMRTSLMAVLPGAPPGLTQTQMLEAILPKLSQQHFPGGDKAMWWIKTVQLDQEARGGIKRSDSNPLRWWKT